MLNHNIISDISNFLAEDNRWEVLNRHNNNWAKDKVFKNYHKLGNKQKGVAGEYFVERLMEKIGSSVSSPIHTDHDRIIDGYKTEIKFSLAVSKGEKIIDNKFIINHIAMCKDWDRLIFCGINPKESLSDRVNIYFFDKKDFINYMKHASNPIFKHQQSGQKAGNDDFICTKFAELIDLPFVKEINLW